MPVARNVCIPAQKNAKAEAIALVYIPLQMVGRAIGMAMADNGQ